MSTTVLPSIYDLVLRAIDDHGALINIAWTKHLTDATALRIATDAIDGAIADWSSDLKVAETAVPDGLRKIAVAQVLTAGWTARETLQQADIEENRPIWEGSARHEARAELG